MCQVPAFAVVRTGYLPAAYHCLLSASIPTFPLCWEIRALGRRWQGGVESECGQEQIQSQKLGTVDQFVIQRDTETGASCKYITIVPVFKDWARADPQEALQNGSNTTHYMTTVCVYSRPPTHLRRVFDTKSAALQEPQWHELANELWWLDRKKAVDIVLLPSPVQQNICWGRLRCFYLVTLCGLRATTTK